jgi:hypothetical protein
MEPIVAKYGTYGDIFETFLRHGLKTYAEKSGCDVELVVTKANMVDMGALPVVDEVDCILLTGSSKSRATYLDGDVGSPCSWTRG